MIMRKSHCTTVLVQRMAEGAVHLMAVRRTETRLDSRPQLTDQTSQSGTRQLSSVHTTLALPPLVYGCLSILSLDSLCQERRNRKMCRPDELCCRTPRRSHVLQGAPFSFSPIAFFAHA